MCEFDACERDMAILRPRPFRIAATCTPSAPSRLAGAPCTTCTATTCTAAAPPAFCSCTTRNTMRSANTRPLLLCLMGPAPRTSSHRPDALTRPCSQHQAPVPPHIRQVAGAALPPRARPRVQRRSSAETPLSVLRACTHPHTPHRGCATPTDASIPRPFHNRIHRFPRLPPQPQLPFAPLPACAALAVRCFFIASPELRRLRRCPPPLPRAVVDAGAPHARRPAFARWEPDAQRHRRVQCSTPSASEIPRSNRRGCATSLRGAATRSRRRTAPTHSTPRRRPPRPGSIQRVTLAFPVPTSPSPRPRCATRLPPSPLDGRACRVLQYYPQHVPRLQRAPRSFLIAGAVFVAFSYVTTIYCLYRSTCGLHVSPT
ncbi:hypothetical protein B0H14DRAFT_1325098 [Mycena olivaceomarginata]|nr:hypothetical protein B0H14DRAFT_1325098 [Mycena olivaceomarginata]